MRSRLRDYSTDMLNLFKRKKPDPPYDYDAALAELSARCVKSTAYDVIMPSVYYDCKRGAFAAHFECSMREWVQKKGKRNNYFLSLRRTEKIFGPSLADVLDFAVTYAGYPDAFVRSPQDNMPEGFSIIIKNMIRVPGGRVKEIHKGYPQNKVEK